MISEKRSLKYQVLRNSFIIGVFRRTRGILYINYNPSYVNLDYRSHSSHDECSLSDSSLFRIRQLYIAAGRSLPDVLAKIHEWVQPRRRWETGASQSLTAALGIRCGGVVGNVLRTVGTDRCGERY